jgi:hypothetical protein
MQWEAIARAMRLPLAPSVGLKLQAIFYKYLLTFDQLA